MEGNERKGRIGSKAALAVLMMMSVTTLGFTEGAPDATKATEASIAIFVPGVVSGSPIYELLVAGVQQAAAERPGTKVKTVEGGFNQADWGSKLTSLAATGEYGLIVSSNQAMPAIAASVSQRFPTQRFLLLDGELSGNPSIFTLAYNQREQGYMAGFLAGLATTGGVAGANAAKKIGLVAGQEYPAMNGTILPAYTEGAKAVDPSIEVDFRVVGNWYDAAKGAELAAAMIREGVDVVLAISGGANQGVVQAAADAKASVIWFDVNGYAVRPGTVIGSSVLRQDKAAYEQVKRWLDGKLPFGTAVVLGVADGYVDFIQDDPEYIKAVSESARASQAGLVAGLKSGTIKLPLGGNPGSK